MHIRNRLILVGAGAALVVGAAYLFSSRARAPRSTETPATGPPAQTAALPSGDVWQQAAAAIRHVPLDSFELPELVGFAFSAYRCDVPQPHDAVAPTNVVSGSFAAPDQTDWAALCTRGDSSYIMIVWGGPAHCPTPTAAAANIDFLQGMSEGKIGYARGIGEASTAYILEHAREYRGPLPPSTNHAGIEDAFLGKSSVIHYCYAGQWLALQGAD